MTPDLPIVIQYKKLLSTSLSLSLQGTVYKDRYVYREDSAQGMLFVKQENFPDPVFVITQRTRNVPCVPGNSLHVSSACRTKRDIFRNSGYKLKRDPGTADYVVIPDCHPTYRTLEYPIIVEHNDEEQSVTLISVDLDDCYFRNDRQKCTDILCEYIQSMDIWKNATIHIDLDDDFICWTIPFCEEYKDILENNNDYSYIKETDVPLKPGTYTTITPEVLDVWKRCKDISVLDASICASDWAKYPATLLIFLKIHHESIARERISSNLRMVLRMIKFEPNYDLKDNIRENKIVVSPDDWAMLQAFIAYELHLQDGKGWFPLQWDDFMMKYIPFMRARIAVANMPAIDKPTQLFNICN